MNLSNSVNVTDNWTTGKRNEKKAVFKFRSALLKRQNDISHICVKLLQCKPSAVVSSSYFSSLSKSESLDPQTTETGVLKFWMQQDLQATMLQKDFESMRTFLFLTLCFIGYQGSLWT